MELELIAHCKGEQNEANAAVLGSNILSSGNRRLTGIVSKYKHTTYHPLEGLSH